MARKPEELSRADQIRARRHIEPVKRKPIERAPQESTQRAARSASRVVTRRQYTDTQATPQAESSRGNRPVYIPTGTPGKELRLPAVPRVSVGMRVFSGILALLLLVGVISMLKSDSFKVNPNGINIRGNFRVSNAEIASKLSSYGTRIIEVEPNKIEQVIIRDFPDIKTVKVGVSLPANLNVLVVERIPSIIWFVDATEETEASQIWIDDEGYSFEVRGAASLPIEVYANTTPPPPFKPVEMEKPTAPEETETEEEVFKEPEPNVDPRLVEAIQALNQLKPQGTQLRYDARRGLGWVDPNYGWMVYFGRSAEHLDLKMAQYQKIAELILERNLQPTLISLEFLHAPYFR
ncbi:MAG TPA: FtsQ-type POTRA domain-containing protein [Anaerolineaceae bacterium]|nr:FtsQ-type POTRA domain-containing protein [Anaerolineaceae bacterium]